jgi:hypothetical protein
MNKIDAQLLAKMFLAGAKNLESKKEIRATVFLCRPIFLKRKQIR